MNLTEEQIFFYFFVISINDKRLEEFQKQFKKAGFKKIPELWHGATLKSNYYKSFDDYPDKLVHYKWLLSLCNGFGHFFLVEMARHMKWPFVTIFEDDAVPVDNIHKLIKTYCTDIPDDADILKLGYTGERHHSFLLYKDDKFVSIDQKGSHAYIVFQKEYERFLSDSIINPRADVYRFNPHNGVKSYSCITPLFIQKNIDEKDTIHFGWSSINRPKENRGWYKDPTTIPMLSDLTKDKKN